MGINVAQLLRQPALRTPERVAVVTVDERGRTAHTIGELDLLARRVAGQLTGARRVALLADNGAEFVAAWFGAAYAGATLVPVPHGSPPAELAQRVAHAACDAVLTDAAHADTARAALAMLPRRADPASPSPARGALALATHGHADTSSASPSSDPASPSPARGALALATHGHADTSSASPSSDPASPSPARGALALATHGHADTSSASPSSDPASPSPARGALALATHGHADTSSASPSSDPVRHALIGDLLAADVAPVAHPADTTGDDPAMILYTSGTTADPRGAVIGHASLVLHTTQLARHTVQLGPDDAILGALPLTHSYGCRMVMLLALATGARAVLVPRFSAGATLDLAHTEAVTWIPAVPTMFAAWAATEGPPPPALRWCLSAGAPLPDAVRVRAEARLGADIRQGYGMTEATFSTIDAPPAARTPGSVGAPVWGVEVRVVDPAGRDLPPDIDGHVLLRGPNQMLGYLDAPDASRAIAPDGWIRSGDVGRLDPDGRLAIVDRLKDLILRGGHSVYPSEVEAALMSHPSVAQAAVIGRPDDFLGEAVVAVIVLRAGATLDRAALAGHLAAHLTDYKCPRELAVVDALPLGPSRKVLKRALRDALAAGRLDALPL